MIILKKTKKYSLKKNTVFFIKLLKKKCTFTPLK